MICAWSGTTREPPAFPPNAQEVSIEAYNLDCRAVLAALCIKTVPLLSLGMGVHMAANFAARYPEQASALLSLLPQIDIDSISQVTATVDRLVPQRRADLWASWCDPERTDPPEHFVRLMNNSEAPENRSRHVNAIAHHDARGTLRTIHAPTLVVHWDNDLWSTGPELARLIPNARLVVREGRGYPWYDPDPEGLHALIRDFVLEHAEPPAPAPLTPVASAPRHAPHLTPRELEVLRLIADGLSNAAIGEALVISPGTVARHVTNLLNKTGCRNRAEAARYAAEHGLTGS